MGPRRWLFLAVALLLVGATSIWLEETRRQESPWKADADLVAANHGWEASWIRTEEFTLLSYSSAPAAHSALLTVYIEGDGLAWENRQTLSKDPTPRSTLVLNLATSDPGEMTAYVARPCQYLASVDLTGCPSRFWSLARYSEAVVWSVSQAIDVIKHRMGAVSLRLVGYSGGGQIAAYVTAFRTDVESLITIAGNLDHLNWTTRLGVTPLRHSLNAADIADHISHIPQVHFVGELDDNVTASDAESFLARMTDRRQSHLVVVPRFTHRCCWEEDWPELLEQAEMLTRS